MFIEIVFYCLCKASNIINKIQVFSANWDNRDNGDTSLFGPNLATKETENHEKNIGRGYTQINAD
jgi:hypothetical protein